MAKSISINVKSVFIFIPGCSNSICALKFFSRLLETVDTFALYYNKVFTLLSASWWKTQRKTNCSKENLSVTFKLCRLHYRDFTHYIRPHVCLVTPKEFMRSRRSNFWMDSLLRLDFFFKIENQDRSFEQGIVTTAVAYKIRFI